MISDGAGCNSWLAASMYQGKVGRQVYDGPGWQHCLVTTYPLNTAAHPTLTNVQDPALVYDPHEFWDVTPSEAATGQKFAGYLFAMRAATESSSAATALATGIKSFGHSINWDDNNRPLYGQTIAELAKARGKKAGAITTVLWCDATPAGLGSAHNVNRSAYGELINEMLDSPTLDVVMGAGHPYYDDDGNPVTEKTPDRQWALVGGEETWRLLQTGAHPGGWTLIETKDDFESLAHGTPPRRVAGVARVASAFQCNRSNDRRAKERPSLAGGRGLAEVNNDRARKPFETPFNSNVPSLSTMTQGAIHCMEENPDGFFLMIEGGAIDWANHGNNAGRMIEEQIDFLAAVETVIQWIETHEGWDQTLLILTADHETGMLWGPESDTTPFQPLADNGPGKVPGLKYNSGGHTNSLVPLYARGKGSERLAEHVRGTDARAAKVWSGFGDYIDNTDIFSVMKEAIDADCR